MSVAVELQETRRQELERREAIIEQHLKSFTVVGNQMRMIRDGRHYRDEYGSWGAYLKERWEGIGGKAYVNRVILATWVVENLAPIGAVVPLTETQARPLTKLSPDEQRIAWQRVLDAATSGDIPITERLVRDVVETFLRERAPSDDESDLGAALYYTVEAWERLPEAERRRIVEQAPAGGRTRFNKTNDRVEWSWWTWNPVTGCDHGCDYCYARVLADRYYLDLPEGERFTPVFRPTRLWAPRLMEVPDAYDPDDPLTIGHKNVFVCSMADLFGKWVPQDWIDAVFAEVVDSPDWNYLFLTKFPQRLAEQAWPENAWCGASVDIQARVATAERSFRGVQAGVRWLSCEPLLERLTFSDLSMFDWVVIGAQTANAQVPEYQPPWEWVEHLIAQARAAGCQVYLKPNLTSRPREYPVGAQP